MVIVWSARAIVIMDVLGLGGVAKMGSQSTLHFHSASLLRRQREANKTEDRATQRDRLPVGGEEELLPRSTGTNINAALVGKSGRAAWRIVGRPSDWESGAKSEAKWVFEVERRVGSVCVQMHSGTQL
jgi:hypothetical protein